jgi:hypothetical protein
MGLSAKGLATLFIGVAFWLVGNGLQKAFAIDGGDGFQCQAKINRVSLIGLENVSIIGMAPNQCYPLFLTNFVGLICGYGDGLCLTDGVSAAVTCARSARACSSFFS